MRILRWYIARAHPPAQLPEGTRQAAGGSLLEVVVSLAAEGLQEVDRKQLAGISADRLDYWHQDEAGSLEGWLWEQQLLAQLATLPAARHKESAEAVSQERRITEDMVLLQLAPDYVSFEELWQRLRQAPGLPELTELAGFRRSRWMDFTQPARKMSKQVYLRALGILPAAEQKEGGDESKR